MVRLCSLDNLGRKALGRAARLAAEPRVAADIEAVVREWAAELAEAWVQYRRNYRPQEA